MNLLCVSVATSAQLSSPQELLDSLAPTGKLRASLYLGGPTNVIVHPTTGEMKGVGYEIGKELARLLGIPYEPVIYKTPKLLVDDIESDNYKYALLLNEYNHASSPPPSSRSTPSSPASGRVARWTSVGSRAPSPTPPSARRWKMRVAIV